MVLIYIIDYDIISWTVAYNKIGCLQSQKDVWYNTRNSTNV